MPSQQIAVTLLTAITFLGAYLLQPIHALDIAYCSTLNTSGDQRNISIYQSNGLCQQFCFQDYAFAIVQYNACWCSNYVPGTIVQTSDCSYQCPGYPSEFCGGDGVFGYIALNLLPSGTQSAGSSASTTKAPTQVTITESGNVVTSTVGSAQTSSLITSVKSSSTASWTGTPIISIQTVTGQVQTITYTPAAPPTTDANQSALDRSGNGLNTGQAVGLTFGLVAFAFLVAGIIFFCVRKRNKQKRLEAEAESGAAHSSGGGSSNTGNLPQRTMSENSRFMLQTDGRQVVEGWETADTGTPGSRVSRLLPVDPRLDPYAGPYQRNDASKSGESVRSIQDNYDYSRRMVQSGPILRATNPD